MSEAERLWAEVHHVLGLVERCRCWAMCATIEGETITPMDTREFMAKHVPDALAYVEALHERLRRLRQHEAERWPGEHSGRGEDGQGTRGGRGGCGQSPEQALATLMAMGMSEERARAMLGDRAPVTAKPAPGSRP